MTHVASTVPVLTRFGALVRAARDSRPLTSLSGDQLAMGLSGLCLVHCLATTIFFASIASVGGVFLENHLFHEIGLIVAIGFALITLVSGVLSHGYMMPFAVGSFGLGMMAG
ncbi:MAG: MerC domain-containing protein, partial [Sphingopyxis sp.]|uniref:MerC domain-containing protein n=1 Tax=Sphingopyxis sp. TaxID=1908224 RepID=UPI001A31B041